MQELSILMILKLLLNTQIIWMIIIKYWRIQSNKWQKILIVFDDRIADMLSNKKINPIIIELFIRGRKLNISLVFMTQSYFAVPRNIRLNSTCYFIMKISKKKTFNKSHLIIHWILTFKTYIKAIFVSGWYYSCIR